MQIYKTREAAAKKWALAHGHRGGKGGWIFAAPDARGATCWDKPDRKPICQGWFLYAMRLMDRGVIVGDWKSGFQIVKP